MAHYTGPSLSMDQIDQFFNLSKPLPKVKAKYQTVIPHKLTDHKEQLSHFTVHDDDDELYPKHYQQVDELGASQFQDQLTATATSNQDAESMISGYSDITGFTNATEAMDKLPKDLRVSLPQTNLTTVFEYDDQLPISRHRKMILEHIEHFPVVIIQGSTGCGKTTQVPQYIFDHYMHTKRESVKMVITQPRKIAAISIARRVCGERHWSVGDICGYQIQMENKTSERTSIAYMTTGVLLQKLIADKNLQKYTHIILDEVHERDVDTDFCMLLAKKLQRSNSRNVKIILMSASIETDKFSEYFAFMSESGKRVRAPVINIDEKLYSVSEYYLDNLDLLLKELRFSSLKHFLRKLEMNENEPEVRPQQIAVCCSLIKKFAMIEAEEQGLSVNDINLNRGSVLVFLPGFSDIMDVHTELTKISQANPTTKLRLVVLHSQISNADQCRAFEAALAGERKVILSTNIAESSITVPDIKYVIDFCLTKAFVREPRSNLAYLRLEWASKSSCLQRKGRAGRVSNGRVYRLISRRWYQEFLPDTAIPEIVRAPLEVLILRVKMLDIGGPKSVLALALDPPNLSDIKRSVLVLKQIGAMTLTCQGLKDHSDGDLTFIGRVLARLPVDVYIGKLLIFGYLFGVLSDALTVAAGLYVKSIFEAPFDRTLHAFKQKLIWSKDSLSDCFAIINAYNNWRQRKDTPGWINSEVSRQWYRENMLERKCLNELDNLRTDLERRLKYANIHCLPANMFEDCPVEHNDLIFKIVLAAAFYPNFFLVGKADEKEIRRYEVCSDPFKSVTLGHLPPKQGVLYRSQIKRIFEFCHPRPIIRCEETRAYIEFPSPMVENIVLDDESRNDPMVFLHRSNPIPQAVYLALKMSKNHRLKMRISLFPELVAKRLLEEVIHAQRTQFSSQKSLRSNFFSSDKRSTPSNTQELMTEERYPIIGLPQDKESVQILVTEVESPSSFWATYADAHSTTKLFHICNELNKIELKERPCSYVWRAGECCVAPFEEAFYRAIIKRDRGKNVSVFFVDYGNTDIISKKDLKIIPKEFMELPAQAIRCRLAEIQPNRVHQPNGEWSESANERFLGFVKDKEVEARIYSIVDRTLVVRLRAQGKVNVNRSVDVNNLLVQEGWAEKIEEDFVSRTSHNTRIERLRSARLSSTNKPSSSAAPNHIDEDSTTTKFFGGFGNNNHQGFASLPRRESTVASSSSIRPVFDKTFTPNGGFGDSNNKQTKNSTNEYNDMPPPTYFGRDSQGGGLIGSALIKNSANDDIIPPTERQSLPANVSRIEEVDLDIETLASAEDIEKARRCNRWCHPSGPTSILQVSVYPLAFYGKFHYSATHISSDSINHVILDDDPPNPRERLMIAACVNLSQSESIRVKETTILPNIPSIAALIAVIFAPSVEWRLSQNYIVGALCGLGWNQDRKQAMLSECDMEVAFDNFFGNNDIKMVNEIRSNMNFLLKNNPDNPDSAFYRLTTAAGIIKNLRDTLLNYILMQRKPMKRTENFSFQWNQVNHHLISPTQCNRLGIYELIPGLKE